MLARALRRQTPSIRRNYATAPAPTSPDGSHIMKRNIPRVSPSLLQRQNARMRQLPTLRELNPWRIWLLTLPPFIAILTVSALGIFNYQKVNSPVITANLYSLRTNPEVREVLGSEVYFGSQWAWIHGSINLVSGRIDVWFSVKGTKQTGICTFKANRYGGKSGTWRTVEWSLLPDGKTKPLDLLESSGDPMTEF